MKTPSLLEFNRILDSVSHEDNIGHLFVVDIKFRNRNSKQCYLTRYMRPFSRKNKTVQAHERSTIQLMSVLRRNHENDIINNIKCTAKTHSTLDEKKIYPSLCRAHPFFS